MGYTNEKCPIAFMYAKTVPTLINGKKNMKILMLQPENYTLIVVFAYCG